MQYMHYADATCAVDVCCRCWCCVCTMQMLHVLLTCANAVVNDAVYADAVFVLEVYCICIAPVFIGLRANFLKH